MTSLTASHSWVDLHHEGTRFPFIRWALIAVWIPFMVIISALGAESGGRV
jgi:hypothetical protein